MHKLAKLQHPHTGILMLIFFLSSVLFGLSEMLPWLAVEATNTVHPGWFAALMSRGETAVQPEPLPTYQVQTLINAAGASSRITMGFDYVPCPISPFTTFITLPDNPHPYPIIRRSGNANLMIGALYIIIFFLIHKLDGIPEIFVMLATGAAAIMAVMTLLGPQSGCEGGWNVFDVISAHLVFPGPAARITGILLLLFGITWMLIPALTSRREISTPSDYRATS